MFGNNNQSSGGGFSFGGASTAQKPAFSFGSTGSTPGATTTTTPAAPTTITPAAPTTGGFSFGAKPAGSSTTTTTPSGGFSFGAKPAGSATTTSTPSGGFSFGAKPATTPAPGVGGFGTSSTPTAPATTGGFSFGSKPAGTNTTTPSLFGNNSTATGTGTTSGSLFGAKPAGTTSSSTGTSLFQSQQQPQQQHTQQQQPQQSLVINSQPSFAWSKPSNALTSGNNQATPGTFNPQQQVQNVPNVTTTTNPNPRDYTPTINDKLEKIKSSWDPSSPQCKMVTYLYNKVDPTFNNFTRPVNESPEAWEEAMRNRPKEYNSIPVKCSGFTELYERNQLQENHVKQTRILLNEMNDKLRRMNEKHDLHSNTLLMKCKIKQRDLNIKLLRIAINLSILKYKGYPLTNDEELLIEKFKSLLAKLDDPVGLNRVNELWARLSSLKEKYMDTAGLNQVSVDNNTEEGESSDVMKKLVKVLAKQQQGIQLLCELMEEDEAKIARLSK